MIVDVQVKPGSKKGPLIQPSLDGHLLVYVREPALEGKANRAVVEMLADYYKVPKTKIQLISGLTSRQKRFKIGN
ncbi:MAG: DUF167 domain-containing protein [Thiobacillus sp.]